MSKQISILIPTLPTRIDKFSKLITALMEQIVHAKLDNEIQIVSFMDCKEITIGEKRNQLISMSSGKYIGFIDDDDIVSSDYVSTIYQLSKSDKDCITFDGMVVSRYGCKEFNMSLHHKKDSDSDKHFRIPNHLAFVKRGIALKCPFPKIQYGEDSDYSKRLLFHLKTEAKTKKKLYIYNFNERNSQTHPNSVASAFFEPKI